MKKLIIISILLSVIISQSAFAIGMSKFGTVTAMVTVKGVFQMSFSRSTVDFSTAAIGKSADSDSGVSVVAKTNGDNSWHLQVSNDKPLSSGNSSIPNKYFTWMEKTGGAGQAYGKEYSQFDDSPRLAYSSSDDEGNNMPGGTKNDFAFRLYVPENQAPGEYSCTVLFTMTE